MDARARGRMGEELAAEYLKRRRYRILTRNFSCRMGEIDIIARHKRYLVFIEVKLRKSAAFAEAREFVYGAKQQRIIAAAERWLQLNPTTLQPRFDVIEVYVPDDHAVARINHIENAFEL